MIFRGSGSILLGNPISLCFFRGGGGRDPLSPPLDLPMEAQIIPVLEKVAFITAVAPNAAEVSSVCLSGVYSARLRVPAGTCVKVTLVRAMLKSTVNPVLSGHSKNRQNKDLNDKW